MRWPWMGTSGSFTGKFEVTFRFVTPCYNSLYGRLYFVHFKKIHKNTYFLFDFYFWCCLLVAELDELAYLISTVVDRKIASISKTLD